MLDRLPILALLALASLPVAAATPAERTYSVSGFDRVRIDVELMEQLLRRGYRQIAGTLARSGDMPGCDPSLGIDQVDIPARKLRLKLGIRLDTLGKMNGNRSNRCVFHW